jgi:hypothetical protein
MASVIVGMTSSLDGFVADERGSASKLYPDLEALRGTQVGARTGLSFRVEK